MKRFVIFGQANSGSNILCQAFNNHPEVLSAGEIFHYIPEKRRSEYRRSLGFSGRDHEIYAMNGDLNGYFYDPARKQNSSPKCAGFTLLYEHCCLAWAHAELGIERDNSIIIIDIRYKNPFYLMSNWWKQNSMGKVHISPEAAKRWLDVRMAWLSWLEDRRETHQVIPVEYSELLANYNSVMAELFSYLELPDIVSVSPRLPIEESLRLRDKIENIAELRRQFSNSHWEQYLNDDPVERVVNL